MLVMNEFFSSSINPIFFWGGGWSMATSKAGVFIDRSGAGLTILHLRRLRLAVSTGPAVIQSTRYIAHVMIVMLKGINK